MPKKPTGKTGPIQFNKRGLKFHKIKFPETKEEIELFIAERYLKFINSVKPIVKEIRKNPENDFDFTFVGQSGKERYVELMEIVPEGGYIGAGNSYNNLEMAEYIFKKIKEGKSDRYSSDKEVELLIYPTDFKFHLSDVCLHLLGYFISQSGTKFNSIFYFSLLDESEGHAHLLFPREEDYTQVNPEDFKDGFTILPDPEKARHI